MNHPRARSCAAASALVLALAAAAGCGGDDDDGGPSEAKTVTETDTGSEVATAPGTRNTTGITGSWKGEGTETGPGGSRRRYPVEITINSLQPGQEAGPVAYPSFPCSGVLRLYERRGATYVFDEQIDEGRDRCELQGRVELRRDGERLSYRWSTPKTKNLTVRAALGRN